MAVQGTDCGWSANNSGFSPGSAIYFPCTRNPSELIFSHMQNGKNYSVYLIKLL